MTAHRSYTEEDKVQVRALLVQGWSGPHIETELGIPCRTVYNWRDGWPEMAKEIQAQIDERAVEIIRLAQGIEIRQLEHYAEKVESGPLTTGEYHGVIMDDGVQRDKLFKGREVDHRFKGDIHVDQAVFIIKKGD
jgi:hypothetical protein